MNTEQFEKQIEEFRYRLNLMRETRESEIVDESALLEQAFQELNISLEELRITEEELYQQNEEMILTRHAIEQERERYISLFENAPDGYILTDLHGKILEINRMAALMLSASPALLKRKNLVEYIDISDRKNFRNLLIQPEETHRTEQKELLFRSTKKRLFPAIVTYNIMTNPGEKIAVIRWTIRDVTEGKQAELALKRSEQRFRTIFNRAHNGIVLINRSGHITEANRALQEMLATNHAELCSKQASQIFHPDSSREGEQNLSDLLEGRVEHYHQEIRLRNSYGETVWANLSASAFQLDDNADVHAILLIENIGDRKRMEAQLEEIRKRLIIGTERERLRLSQELHDGPLQDLYGIFFQLNLLMPKIQDPEQSNNLGQIRNSLKQVMDSLRMMSYELRPPALSHYGLAKAILSYSERFKQYYSGIDIFLDLANDEKKLDEETRLCLFRNYQHAMVNVVRHAAAEKVWITLNMGPNEIVLEVKDNGRGFQPAKSWVELVREGHLGLAGCAERAEAMGGKLEVETHPGQGTLIRTTLPHHAPGTARVFGGDAYPMKVLKNHKSE